MPDAIVVGDRYALEPARGSGSRVERYRGTDRQLERAVLGWSIAAEEGDATRASLLDTARAVAQLDSPAFLRVLDIVPERDRLSVILEAPARRADEPAAPDAGHAVLALLDAIETIEDRAGVTARPAVDDAFEDGAGDVRFDPIGICYRTARTDEPVSAQLAETLYRLLGDQGGPTATRLRSAIAPWRRTDHPPAGGLDDLRRALRQALAGPADGAAPAPPVAAPPVAAPPTAAPSAATPRPAASADDTVPLAQWPPQPPGGASSSHPAPASAAAATTAAAAGHPERSAPERRRHIPGDAPAAAAAAGSAAPARRRGGIPPGVTVTAIAALLVVVLGGIGIFVAAQLTQDQTGQPPPVAANGNDDEDDDGPPAQAPDPGQVTVGLEAQESANVRVTVDGVVEFDGVLSAGDSQFWEGGDRIQVWTDSGQTLLLSVNGEDLGPYAPAMGHPDWNRIDYGFWPGWAQ